jgi:hypothetical protein
MEDIFFLAVHFKRVPSAVVYITSFENQNSKPKPKNAINNNTAIIFFIISLLLILY